MDDFFVEIKRPPAVVGDGSVFDIFTQDHTHLGYIIVQTDYKIVSSEVKAAVTHEDLAQKHYGLVVFSATARAYLERHSLSCGDTSTWVIKWPGIPITIFVEQLEDPETIDKIFGWMYKGGDDGA